MKKIGIVVFAAALVIGVAFSSLFSFGRLTGRLIDSTFGASVAGSGKIASETRDISGFTSVEAGGAFQVEVVAQKNFGVRVDADDNLLPYVTTAVRGGVLKIETSNRVRPTSAIRVRVYAPNIESVESSGAASVTIADLKNSFLSLDASGSSKITAAGETARLDVSVSGAAGVDSENLTSVDAAVDASGAGRVAVNVSGTLRSEASGAGRIAYAGDPASVQKEVSGSGTIVRK